MSKFVDANRIVTPGGTATIAELRARGAERFPSWAGETVAFNTADPFVQVEAILAAATIGFELAIMPAERFTPEWRDRVTPLVSRIVGVDGERPGGYPRSGKPAETRRGLVLFTSGSVGRPRAIHHSFESLDTFGSVETRPHVWLVTYLPGTYAWVQVVMLGLLVPGQTLVFPRSLEAGDVLSALSEQDVTAVSSTPTFWRYLLAFAGGDELRRLPVRQITLGGERADQAILDDLHELFPEARLTHIFATTETGPALTVTDGLAGFPTTYLNRPLLGGKVELKIRGGTLWVSSRYSHTEGADWIDTGDVVEIEGSRVHIRGRKDHDAINVAGYKVARAELEDFIQRIEGVRWARVYPARAPLAGNLVGLEAVVDQSVWESPERAEKAIADACRAQFSDYHVPRKIRFLDEVPLTEALKTPV